MLSVSMDLGICSWDRGAGSYSGSFGLVPGVQFSTNFTDAISFGAGMGLGFEFDAFNGKVKNGGELERGVMVNLSLGAEIDYTLNENVLLWGGMNYAYDRLNVEGGEAPVLKYALHPAIGAVFSAGNISVGTYLDVRLNAITIDAKETIGLSGGVDFASL
ncbi:MAG: hypothetical protein LBB56_08295 [Chitinispirillales bacterium]|jgi:hypothetical protein|nr:hypothetical protein [Chitinispirillales bacterium]